MEIAAKTTSMFMLFLLIFVAGGIFLQIFLSKREGKWPGLILPILSVFDTTFSLQVNFDKRLYTTLQILLIPGADRSLV